MASYPDTFPSWVDKVNLEDIVEAAHVNKLQNELDAVLRELDTNPKGSFTHVRERLENIESTKAEKSNLDNHSSNTTNPHSVTASQVGAADSAHLHDGRYTAFVAHGADNTVARPSGVSFVIWVGSVDPDNGATDDVLLRTDQEMWYRFNGTSWVETGSSVEDHGVLTGLGDDDHTHYALADGTRGDFAADPHGPASHSGVLESDEVRTGYNTRDVDTLPGTNNEASRSDHRHPDNGAIMGGQALAGVAVGNNSTVGHGSASDAIAILGEVDYSFSVGGICIGNDDQNVGGGLVEGEHAIGVGYAVHVDSNPSAGEPKAHHSMALGSLSKVDQVQDAVAIGYNVTVSNTSEFRIGHASHDVQVPGDFTVSGTKNFDIPHPIKEDYRIQHAAYEGPVRGGLIYEGTFTAIEGENRVTLPDYVPMIATSLRSYVTPKQLAVVAARIDNSTNEVVIESDRPDIIVDWMVTGERNDPSVQDVITGERHIGLRQRGTPNIRVVEETLSDGVQIRRRYKAADPNTGEQAVPTELIDNHFIGITVYLPEADERGVEHLNRDEVNHNDNAYSIVTYVRERRSSGNNN